MGARGYGNPCDFGVTPVPIGLGFEFGTALGLGLGLRGPDLGLGLDNSKTWRSLGTIVINKELLHIRARILLT